MCILYSRTEFLLLKFPLYHLTRCQVIRRILWITYKNTDTTVGASSEDNTRQSMEQTSKHKNTKSVYTVELFSTMQKFHGRTFKKCVLSLIVERRSYERKERHMWRYRRLYFWHNINSFFTRASEEWFLSNIKIINIYSWGLMS